MANSIIHRRRVVVTGIGMVSPLGNTLKTVWANCIKGKSGITNLSLFENAGLPFTYGGAVQDLELDKYGLSKKDTKRRGKFSIYASAAAHDAWIMSGLPKQLDEFDGDRAGVILGTGAGGAETHSRILTPSWQKKGYKGLSPFGVSSYIYNTPAGDIAQKHNLRAMNFSLVSACASSTHAIGEAYWSIITGRADTMVTGGTEGVLHDFPAMSSFYNMRAIARWSGAASEASRPFDKDRCGFVPAEGAVIFVLENYEHAQRRGANILGEIVGYGATDDCFHPTAPDENGLGARKSMKMALHQARLNPKEINYINAHGTSTPFNDRIETHAIKQVFKNSYQDLAVSSTKSMTGHMIGAAGAMEAAFCIMALQDQVLPPTINYTTPDPDCDLDYVPNAARTSKINYALSNSFGFGGTNGTLIFARV